jgi:hypothetical protein
MEGTEPSTRSAQPRNSYLHELLSRLRIADTSSGQNVPAYGCIGVSAFGRARRAPLQGMRQIGDLAKMNVFSALAGTVLSIPAVYV